MKKYLSLKFFLVLIAGTSFSQPTMPFACPGSQVIAYKQGTSCTATPYQFYTIDLAGVQAATPFFTLTNTSKEVNGLGISGVDNFLYGIEYDRSIFCTFDNFHLVRYDAIGNRTDLGILPAPAGGIVSSALGCVTREGAFLYSVTDASAKRNLAIVYNVALLTASSSTLTAVFKPLTNLCTSTSYADWAVNPTNNKLYTYGIYNNGGVSTGTVVEIDPTLGTITCVGSPNSTEFLDITRDNFGGVYFEPNGYLYGVNVNTRKLYQINITTGAITYLSTMSGAGQIRADMGSCANGTVVLPIRFVASGITNNTSTIKLEWEMAEVDELSAFTIEVNNEDHYSPMKTMTVIPGQKQYSAVINNNGKEKFRVKAIMKTGGFAYSSILSIGSKSQTQAITLKSNPVTDHLDLNVPSNIASSQYQILNASGIAIRKGQLVKNSTMSISVNNLPRGLYIFVIDASQPSIKFLRM